MIWVSRRIFSYQIHHQANIHFILYSDSAEEPTRTTLFFNELNRLFASIIITLSDQSRLFHTWYKYHFGSCKNFHSQAHFSKLNNMFVNYLNAVSNLTSDAIVFVLEFNSFVLIWVQNNAFVNFVVLIHINMPTVWFVADNFNSFPLEFLFYFHKKSNSAIEVLQRWSYEWNIRYLNSFKKNYPISFNLPTKMI